MTFMPVDDICKVRRRQQQQQQQQHMHTLGLIWNKLINLIIDGIPNNFI